MWYNISTSKFFHVSNGAIVRTNRSKEELVISQRMDSKQLSQVHEHMVWNNSVEGDRWRPNCSCYKTSEKLREILKSFPTVPPPTATSNTYESLDISAYRAHASALAPPLLKTVTTTEKFSVQRPAEELDKKENNGLAQVKNRSWQIVFELVKLLQMSVTATALALYYLIYCYMQLVYYTLRSALYFHQADGPMKITIGVVTLTSIVVGFNIIIRMEKLIGIF